MTGSEACRAARALLEQAGLYNENELNSLFRAATGADRFDASFLPLTGEQEEAFFSLVERRTQGEPLQYLCGEWPFLDFTVRVDGRALIPRPETELLAERAANALKGRAPSAVLDLCSGSGVLAIALKRAFPEAEVTAVELSADACSLLRENAALNGTDLRVLCADAASYAEETEEGPFDLILCNPPYVTPADYESNYGELRFEPRMAFIGGEDGLFFYRALLPLLPRLLKADGLLALEIGNDQGPAVTALLEENGYRDAALYRDYEGLDRDLIARAPCKTASRGV